MRSALLLLVLAACSSSPKPPEPTPLQPIAGSQPLRVLWRASVGAARQAALRPATAGDAVFAAAGDGELARFDLGRETWRMQAAKQLAGGVAADARYVVVGAASGQLIAVEAANGKVAWRTTVPGEPVGAPLMAGDVVISRVGDNQLLAHELATGKQLWVYQRAQAPLSLRVQSGLLLHGSSVVAGFSGGKLVALDLKTGLPRWEAAVAIPRGSNEIERLSDVVGDPVLRGEQICVAAFQGRVACVNAARGSLSWSRDISSAVGVDADERQLYVTDELGAVHALDLQTGASVWKQDKLLHRGGARPFAWGGKVAVADAQGWLHLLARDDGRFLARVELDSSGVTAPLLPFGDERLVAQSLGGSVYLVSGK